MYLHEHTGWTHFVWDDAQVLPLIGQVRFAQGELLGTIRPVSYTHLDVYKRQTLDSVRKQKEP